MLVTGPIAHLGVLASDPGHGLHGRLHGVVAGVVIVQVLPELGQEQALVLLRRKQASHHQLGARTSEQPCPAQHGPGRQPHPTKAPTQTPPG